MEYNEFDTLGEYLAEIQAEEVAKKVKKEQEKVVVQNAQIALNMLRPSSTPAPSPEVLNGFVHMVLRLFQAHGVYRRRLHDLGLLKRLHRPKSLTRYDVHSVRLLARSLVRILQRSNLYLQ